MKCFGTSQLEFDAVELYQHKVQFTYKQRLPYPLICGFLCKEKSLAIFLAAILI